MAGLAVSHTNDALESEWIAVADSLDLDHSAFTVGPVGLSWILAHHLMDQKS
jgi:hypothetical protein